MTENNSLFVYLLKYIGFLILCFFLQRVLFLSFNFSAFYSLSVVEIIKSFFIGLRLDFSVSAFIALVPLILASVERVWSNTFLKKLHYYYTILIILFLVIIGIANATLYKEWNSVLNNRALQYLKHPNEIIASLSTIKLILLLFLIFLLFLLCIQFYRKTVLTINVFKTKNYFDIILTPISIFILLTIMARGGLQLSPVNVSSAYFSNSSAINHLTVNPTWHLASDVIASKDENKYRFYSDVEANKQFEFFLSKTKDSIAVLNTAKPNMLFIVVESFSANAIGHYGCTENITPNFDALAKEGIIFDSIYSSGFRTEQGVINIFSGFPAQPDASIITQTNKAEKLPSLFNDFKNNGYHTSFYYGGEIEFANIGAYLRLNKLDKISTVKEYSAAQKNSKWGAHDEHLFTKLKTEINNFPQPFFSAALTLSNHEPFELPNKKTPNEETDGFKKTVQYTDSCLANFIAYCKNQNWYANTLIVIVADHGHRLPYNVSMNMAAAKHIPLLLLGGAIKKEYVGTVSKKIGNQHDIPATILEQINKNEVAQKYIFSQSLFNPYYMEYAYFTNENVLGWKQKQSSFSYTFPDAKVFLDKGIEPDSTTLKMAKSYLQKVYTTYLNY